MNITSVSFSANLKKGAKKDAKGKRSLQKESGGNLYDVFVRTLTGKQNPKTIQAQLRSQQASIAKLQARQRKLLIGVYGLDPNTTYEEAALRHRQQWQGNDALKTEVANILGVSPKNNWEKLLVRVHKVLSAEESKKAETNFKTLLPAEVIQRSEIYALAKKLGIEGPSINLPLTQLDDELKRLNQIVRVEAVQRSLKLRMPPIPRHFSHSLILQEESRAHRIVEQHTMAKKLGANKAPVSITWEAILDENTRLRKIMAANEILAAAARIVIEGTTEKVNAEGGAKGPNSISSSPSKVDPHMSLEEISQLLKRLQSI